jgi:hypothetical protein
LGGLTGRPRAREPPLPLDNVRRRHANAPPDLARPHHAHGHGFAVQEGAVLARRFEGMASVWP